MSRRKTILILFVTMLKIGAFTFGGGYAMISLLQNEFVSRKKWLSESEFLDVVAIAESTPGPIAINSSTYVGYRMAGFWGSFFSTLAMCIPSFTIIFTISLFFDRFLKFTFVSNAFKGIQVCVIYLILSAGIKMLKSLKKDLLGSIILGTTILCMVLFGLFSIRFSAIFYILISGVIGLFAFLIRKAKREDKQ